MLDNTKLLITDLPIINRMLSHPDFIECKPKNNYYHSLKHRSHGIKMSLDFRKAVENRKVVGYGHLEVNLSPHYHFNEYRHNGNDFTPINCIGSLRGILEYLNIQESEYQYIKVVNLEFGLNVNPDLCTKHLIKGIEFYKKTPFSVGDFPYFKKTDATSYKFIKAYAKGLQFVDVSSYGIDQNVFRFEVKTKQSKNIKTYGINCISDLLKLDTYNRLGQVLLNEWDNILVLNLEPILGGVSESEKEYIKRASKVEFWHSIIDEKHRNTFQVNKEKYYKILKGKNNFHQLVKGRIIDKIFQFLNCANSTQGTTINREISHFEKTPPNRINLEYAHFSKCIVTGLDITMQKKGSHYIGVSGLRFYSQNYPDIFQQLRVKYLPRRKRQTDIETQFYLIAHNIRNAKTNLIHNRKRFELRNYNANQLQIKFH